MAYFESPVSKPSIESFRSASGLEYWKINLRFLELIILTLKKEKEKENPG